MEQVTHNLKCWPRYFWAIAARAKTFELRMNDRTGGFKVGDHLLLQEWCPKTKDYTGSEILVRIDYVCGLPFVHEDMVGMSISIIENEYSVQEIQTQSFNPGGLKTDHIQ